MNWSRYLLDQIRTQEISTKSSVAVEKQILHKNDIWGWNNLCLNRRRKVNQFKTHHWISLYLTQQIFRKKYMFQIILNGEKTSHSLPNCINLTLNQLHISARFGFGSGISSIYWTKYESIYLDTNMCMRSF